MNCILCKSKTRFFLEKKGYCLYRCPKCSLIATELHEPYHTFMKRFYSKGYFTGDGRCSAYADYGRDKNNTLKNMRALLTTVKLWKQSGSLLDVGCAYGYFVELAMHAGFDAQGLDVSAFAVNEASPIVKNKIHIGTLTDISYELQSFDVITLFDVFEHLHTPVEDLKKIHTLLKHDGYVVITTGDTESVLAKILKRKWTFYIPPQHLYFFNKKNITMLLEQTGFQVVSVTRQGKWVSLGYVLHLAKHSSESIFAKMLAPIVRFFHLENLPLYLPLQDNMVVVARKL